MAEENKKIAKKTGPTLVKRKHTLANKSLQSPNAANSPTKKVVRKAVKKAVPKPKYKEQGARKNSSPEVAERKQNIELQPSSRSGGATERAKSSRARGRLAPEQLGQRLREARCKAQPSVHFEVTRPPRKRTAAARKEHSARGGTQSAASAHGTLAKGSRAYTKVNRFGGNKFVDNKRAGKRPNIPRINLRNPLQATNMANSAPLPPAAGGQKSRSDNRRSSNSKVREKLDRRREDLAHFANQLQRKKNYTTADVVPKEISIVESITVSELARKMNLKASDIIAKLMQHGAMTSINQTIDAETSKIVAKEYNCEVKVVSLYEETLIESEHIEEQDYVKRPPVVTIMGHVDHGKTTLLDSLRESEVAKGEHGGITQHIGAYQVYLNNHTITFLDTPGHAAFSIMRARGAQVTDLIVLVIGADEGVMPQTVEAIHHAKEAKVPIMVAITKADLEAANPERIKQQLSEYDLMPDEWGGQTSYVEVSAVTKQGLPELLETIVLETEILGLRAPLRGRAEGKIIEAKIDQGRGIVATVLIECGTLRVGDAYVAGVYSGKVRAMFNEYGEQLEQATPSMPVEIIGLSGAPLSGDPFQVTENEKLARQYGQKRQELKKQEASQRTRITLDNLYAHIRDKDIQELKVIIKGDVYGSVEAVQQALEKLSNSEIRLSCIHAAAGAIIDSDVTLASASNAIIIGFHVRPTAKAQALAEQEKVDIRKYSIIYNVVDDIRTAMEGMLSPDKQEHFIGEVEVRTTFRNSQVGTIAGCMVVKGQVTRKSLVRVFRDNVEIHFGQLGSLRRFKDDAKEVREGFECGLTLASFSDIREGDHLEVIEVREVAKKLQIQE